MVQNNFITNLINKLLSLFCLVCITFLWINFSLRKPILSFIVAILISILLLFILSKLNKKKQNAYNIKKQEIEKINLYSNSLLFSNYDASKNFYKKILTIKFPNLKNNDLYFSVGSETEKIFFIPFFNSEKLCNNDIINIIKNIKNYDFKNDKLVVFCNIYDEINISLLASKNIVLYNKEDCYFKLYKPLNIFPETLDFQVKQQPNKLNKKELLNLAFNKTKSKSYFLCAIFLLVSTFFTKYNIYYIIFTTILFMLAFFSRYNKPFNKTHPSIL